MHHTQNNIPFALYVCLGITNFSENLLNKLI